ncbi:hypothetical protein [Streptantibioticus silvisoli]|uniref:Secreted protein n=1 Tax=Streptantibioticus silvisoli TaxID=2705255 RepID=A0ABT6VWQ7_9ACTN|nr:hypothetical protein [Streptantibioticus silvisoli]MDI5962874.1 hypothetical protein [Streptantibioticus silvisoli]
MARGRHRVSPALHRRLAPLAVAGFSVAVAVGVWFAPAGPHDAVRRGMVAAAAAGALFAAVLMRRWDRSAGKRVADLTAARSRDEWRAEEHLAELESDVEEARAIRQRMEAELRAKRAELAKLRGEHAEVLRRYAHAETERARVLESRRRLAIEAATPPRAIAPPTAAPSAAPTQEAYRRAAAALLALPRNAARQQALRTVETARRREAAAARADGEERPGRHAQPPAGRPHPEPSDRGDRPVREHQLVPAVASAVLPYTQPPRPASRTMGGFDFFGTHKAAPAAPADPAPAGHPRVEHAPAPRPEVIDLTAHDETEQLDVRELRAQG